MVQQVQQHINIKLPQLIQLGSNTARPELEPEPSCSMAEPQETGRGACCVLSVWYQRHLTVSKLNLGPSPRDAQTTASTEEQQKQQWTVLFLITTNTHKLSPKTTESHKPPKHVQLLGSAAQSRGVTTATRHNTSHGQRDGTVAGPRER